MSAKEALDCLQKNKKLEVYIETMCGIVFLTKDEVIEKLNSNEVFYIVQ